MKAVVTIWVLIVSAQAMPADQSASFKVLEKHMPVLENAPIHPSPRIVNGNVAKRGDFPFQAALYIDDNSFCGGSLISTTYVLTAAHCVDGVTTVTVYLGAQNLSAVESGTVTQDTRNITVHGGYNNGTLKNNIALLKLPSAVALSSFIQLISLPKHSDSSQTFVNFAATVSGWGRFSDASNSYSADLRFASLPIISNSDCSLVYGTLAITSTNICTSGSGGKGICTGDSGGPLVITYTGRTIQVGISSFSASSGCAQGYPVAFTKVTSYLNWISTNTGISIG